MFFRIEPFGILGTNVQPFSNMMELLKALYEQFGSDYPRASVAIAAIMGALVFGGSWWLIGKQYDKGKSDRVSFRDVRSTAPMPSPPVISADSGSPVEHPGVTGSPLSSSVDSSPSPRPPPTPTPSLQGEENQEAEIAVKDSGFSPMTMEEYFEQWFHGAKSSLQREELERSMLGRRVIWNGEIRKIESQHSGNIQMQVTPKKESGLFLATAFLDFSKDQRGELVKLREGQTIRFTGVIESFVASPFLRDCKILKVVN